MKLMFFHLMPYTKLPDDFAEKYRSVWVDIDPELFDPRDAGGMYNDFIGELEAAAELGFDAVCVNEHHSNGYGLMPSPNLIAATLARNTRDAAICLLGNSLALYNPPTRVAEEMAMLDTLVHGRTAFLAGVATEIRIGETVLGEEAGFENGHRIVFEQPRTADYRASVHDIANYMMDLMTDSNARQRMGQARRKRAVECYDYRVVAAKLLQILHERLGIS